MPGLRRGTGRLPTNYVCDESGVLGRKHLTPQATAVTTPSMARLNRHPTATSPNTPAAIETPLRPVVLGQSATARGSASTGLASADDRGIMQGRED